MLNEINIINMKFYRGRDYIPIDRNTILGNPFYISETLSREECLQKYEPYIREKIKTDPIIKAKFLDLLKRARNGELNLGCYCSPLPCHGEIIIKILIEMDKTID